MTDDERCACRIDLSTGVLERAPECRADHVVPEVPVQEKTLKNVHRQRRVIR